MQNQSQLLVRLQTIDSLVKARKWLRIASSPVAYFQLFIYRCFWILNKNKSIKRLVPLFWGDTMQIALPACTDIFLLNAKTHDSEIRLTTFLISSIKENYCFVDVGAHYGYFSLLASNMVGSNGKVIALEPSNEAFHLLYKNTAHKKNILPMQKAVSETIGTVDFYEFSTKYNEYNSIHTHQYKDEPWFVNSNIKINSIATITLNSLIETENITQPCIIKIDIEGGEYNALKGASMLLDLEGLTLIMEFQSENNESHLLAHKLLIDRGFSCFSINSKGQLEPCQDVALYFKNSNLVSDNMVYTHSPLRNF